MQCQGDNLTYAGPCQNVATLRVLDEACDPPESVVLCESCHEMMHGRLCVCPEEMG